MLPIVVHLGRRPWRGRCDLRSLVDLAIVPDALRDDVLAATPDFVCTVHDFARSSEVEIRAMALTLPGAWAIAQLQFLATAADEDGLARAFADWGDVMRRVLEAATGRQALTELCSYLLKVSKVPPRRLQVVVGRAIGRAAMKKFVSTYDQLLQEGEARGIAKGKAEGRAEGKAEGKADLVLRLLRHRFGRVPAAVATRLRSAPAGELDRIAERLLDASTLREVFEPA